MNETIDLLTNHRTYRQSDSNYQLSKEQLEANFYLLHDKHLAG